MKTSFILIILCFVLFSCDFNPDDTIVENHSLNYTATMKLKSTNELTINPLNKISIKTSTKSGAMDLQYCYPDKRVYIEYINAVKQFNIYDRQSYQISILNLSGQSGILTANGWMDELNFSDSNSEQTNSNWLLFTFKPMFEAISSDGYPLQVLFKFENNIIRITIN